MASDTVYEKCLPILQDQTLDEEEKTEKLEDLVKQETSLSGKILENAVLDILWRSRNASDDSAPSPPARHTIIRKPSPAPWQVSRSNTPLASSPRSAAGSPAPAFSLLGSRPPFLRNKSAVTASPFTSPKPSPRANFVTPHIPHSPSLNTYEFSESGNTPDIYGDYGSDNVNWLVDEKATGIMSSANAGDGSAASGSSDWIQPQMVEMSPYDIVRSVLRDEKSDEDIERALEANSYDLSAAMASLMEAQNSVDPYLAPSHPDPDKTVLVGKSMSPRSRPVTPAGQAKSKVPCRYWLSTGQCLRADCRFSHDLTTHICKYWLAGNCLAGGSCVFSHDPSALMAQASLNAQYTGTPPPDHVQPSFQLHDQSSFPSLLGATSQLAGSEGVATPAGVSTRSSLPPEFIPSQPQSRPSSRHQSPAPRKAELSMDDSEAFPTLGSTSVKTPKKHHGKRGGHGHGNKDKDLNLSSMADVIRNAPAPPQSPRKSLRNQGNHINSRENSAAAMAIPAPEHIPWLETGTASNKAYLKARQQAIKHGGSRNKFLQSAAQAWHRNDVRAAKALSLRGQSENDLMREAHREAARSLYEDRNRHASSDGEIYIDLHGLHPSEAVSYLAGALGSQRGASALHRNPSSTLYAIVGTGHHSKNGRDKVGKAIRSFLNNCRYVFREFSVPGDRGGSGGILGIDVLSGDASRNLEADGEGDGGGGGGGGGAAADAADADELDIAAGLQQGRIRILKADDAGSVGL